MKTLLYFLCGLLFLPLLFAGCQKDDDDGLCPDETNPVCPDYDPCRDRREPVSADFNLYSGVITWDGTVLVPAGQRVQAGSTIYFEARDEHADSRTWKVGADPRSWSDSSFHLRFSCEMMGQRIPITLSAERLRDTVCADEEILRDALTRELDFVGPDESRVPGKFRGGRVSNPGEEYIIEIKLVCQNWDGCGCQDEYLFQIFNLSNFNCGGNLVENWSGGGHNYNWAYMRRTEPLWAEADNCPLPPPHRSIYYEYMLIQVDPFVGDSIRIDYFSVLPTYDGSSTLVEEHTFLGVRLE